MSKLIANLEILLKKKQMKATNAGEISGAGGTTLTRIMNGTTKDPSISNLIKLAKYFGVTVSVLTGEIKMDLQKHIPETSPCRAPMIAKSEVMPWLIGALEPTRYAWTFADTSERAFIIDLPEEVSLLNNPLMVPSWGACFDPEENEKIGTFRFALISINEHLVVRKVLNDAGNIYFVGGLGEPTSIDAVTLIAPLTCLTEKRLSF